MAAAQDDTPSNADTPVRARELFASFLRLGATAFGGPAMVVQIGELAVRRKRWLTQESFQGGVALCQSIPGATAMQTAAYVGLRAGGGLGALAAYVGFGLPAFLFMLLLSAGYQYHRAHEVRLVLAAFHGLQLVVVAIVANATVNFGRASIKRWQDVLLAVAAAVFIRLGGSPIIAILGAAAIGLVAYWRVEIPLPARAYAPVSGRRLGVRVGLPIFGLLVGLAVLWAFWPRLFVLAGVMLKVDLFAFGGGFASVPLMFNEVVRARGLLTPEAFMDGIAFGQVTPGPIVITATFVGYQVARLAGAVVATLGIFSPSFMMVVLTAPYFDRLQRAAAFRRALRGVLVSFVGLLLAVTVRFAMDVNLHRSATAAVVVGLALVALRLRVNVLWVVLAGVIASAAIF